MRSKLEGRRRNSGGSREEVLGESDNVLLQKREKKEATDRSCTKKNQATRRMTIILRKRE